MTPEQIQDFRTRHNITIAELAEKIGASTSQISSWENGRRVIPLWVGKFLNCLDFVDKLYTSTVCLNWKRQDGRRKESKELKKMIENHEASEQEQLEALGQTRLF